MRNAALTSLLSAPLNRFAEHLRLGEIMKVLLEGLLNYLSPSGFIAVSSGSFPSGQLSPHGLSTLQTLGIGTTNHHPKPVVSTQNLPGV